MPPPPSAPPLAPRPALARPVQVHLHGQAAPAAAGGGKPKDMSKKAVLLSGPPGIGKTSAAHIIARYLGGSRGVGAGRGRRNEWRSGRDSAQQCRGRGERGFGPEDATPASLPAPFHRPLTRHDPPPRPQPYVCIHYTYTHTHAYVFVPLPLMPPAAAAAAAPYPVQGVRV